MVFYHFCNFLGLAGILNILHQKNAKAKTNLQKLRSVIIQSDSGLFYDLWHTGLSYPLVCYKELIDLPIYFVVSHS